MTKEFHCKDVGFDCAEVVQGETEAEVLNKVANHAKEVHNMNEISEDVANKVRSAIREV